MATEAPQKSTPSAYIIRDYGDNVQPRLEIRELQSKHPKQFTLFIQAITNIKKPGYTYEGSDAPSWLQLAGIHGKPYQKWSGDPNGSPGPVNLDVTGQWSGYCHHQSVLFPTWHRVVMLLVEQAVCLEAKAIAHDYSARCLSSGSPGEAEAWKKAGAELRFPFWDWLTPYDAISKTVLPPILTNAHEKIAILEPLNENQIWVQNPLLHYHFEAVPPGFGPDDTKWKMNYFASWGRTYRWPTPNNPHNPAEQYDLLNKVWFDGLETFYAYDSGNEVCRTGPFTLNGDATLRSKVGALFTYPSPDDIDQKYLNNVWDYFSNNGLQGVHEAPCPEPISKSIPSVEDSHDMVHLHVGGYGDMANCDYAAFDPIFFLHHCNVDRIWAFWEYVYPEYWVGHSYYDPGSPQQAKPWCAPLGTFSVHKDQKYGEGSDLIPFRAAENRYWNSMDVKGLQNRKYTYPPVTDGHGTVNLAQPFNKQNRLKDIAVLLNRFTGTNGDPIVLGDEKIPRLVPGFFNKRPPSLPGLPNGHVPLLNYRQFTVVAHLDRYVFRGPYNLELFLLDKERNYPVVQRISVLTRKDADKCAACVGRMDAGALSKGIMTLDSRLVSVILEWRQVNREDASDNDVLNAIGSSLGARLVTAGRDLLADTINEGDVTPLEDAKIPKMTLFSSHAMRQEHTKLGLSFYGSENHFDLPYNPDSKPGSAGWFKKSGPVPLAVRLPEDQCTRLSEPII